MSMRAKKISGEKNVETNEVMGTTKKECGAQNCLIRSIITII